MQSVPQTLLTARHAGKLQFSEVTVDPGTGGHANIPAWLVVDAAYVSRYSIGGTPAGVTR